MRSMVDIEVVIDDNYVNPEVSIKTKARTSQVENIIMAIENVSENDFPMIPANVGNKIELISQRDIVRVFTEGRKISIQTDDVTFSTNKTLSNIEDMLNPERFLRISQSEIINLYKVKQFDIDIAGTIGIEFDNGTKSWASRSRVRVIKDKLRQFNKNTNN